MKRLGLIVVVLGGISAGVWAMRGPSPLKAGQEGILVVSEENKKFPDSAHADGKFIFWPHTVSAGTRIRVTEDQGPSGFVKVMVIEGPAEGLTNSVQVGNVRLP